MGFCSGVMPCHEWFTVKIKKFQIKIILKYSMKKLKDDPVLWVFIY
jgi:hypothetical protein